MTTSVRPLRTVAAARSAPVAPASQVLLEMPAHSLPSQTQPTAWLSAPRIRISAFLVHHKVGLVLHCEPTGLLTQRPQPVPAAWTGLRSFNMSLMLQAVAAVVAPSQRELPAPCPTSRAGMVISVFQLALRLAPRTTALDSRIIQASARHFPPRSEVERTSCMRTA